MDLFGLIKYFELITAVIGTLHYKRFGGSYLKYFLFVLWFTVLVEFVIGTLRQYFGIRFQNNFIYNVITSLQYVYFFLLYYKTLKTDWYKKIVFSFLILFIAAVAVNFLLIQKLTVTAAFHSYTFTIGAILLIITIGLFFVEILNTEMVLYFKRYLMFWISIGLFLFYTGIIPFIISLNLLPAMLSTDSLAIMFVTLNFVMYSCFTVGFILSHKYSN